MDTEHLAAVENTLLCISEARERAERTARAMRREDGDPRLIEALENADRELLAVHSELMRDAYFGSASTSAEQLKLAG